MRVRALLAILLVSSVVAGVPATSRAAARPDVTQVVRDGHRSEVPDRAAWQRRIDALIGGRRMSVTIGDDGRFWYRHLAQVRRAPASNEKLLLSMALLAISFALVAFVSLMGMFVNKVAPLD